MASGPAPVFLLSVATVREYGQLEPALFDAKILALVSPLLRRYQREGIARDLLPASKSLATGLQPLVGRGSLALAQVFGFHAALSLSAALPGAADDALAAAQVAVSEASVGSPPSLERLQFIAEQEMVSAVCLKAKGDAERCVDHCLSAATLLGDTSLAIPLLRQWALIEQDEKLFDQIVEKSSGRAVSEKESYRSFKRSFEFQLNSRNLAAATKLLRPTLEMYRAAKSELDHIATVSLLKNMGQYLALKGERDRADRILSSAGLLAESAGFNGQLVQIVDLLADIRSGQDASLETFRVRDR